MTELLEAVDALTLPIVLHITQETDEGDKAATVEQPSLLEQLDGAIRGQMATTTGGTASLPNTRGVLDSDALFHMVKITSQIRDWCRMSGVERREDPGEALRAWYVAHAAYGHEDATNRFYIRTLHGWRALIEDKLDPANEQLLPEPCPNPECPQGTDEKTRRPTWFDPKTREAYTDPLVIRYRKADGADIVNKARARCRACGSEWSVRELAWEIEKAHEKRMTTV